MKDQQSGIEAESSYKDFRNQPRILRELKVLPENLESLQKFDKELHILIYEHAKNCSITSMIGVIHARLHRLNEHIKYNPPDTIC